MHTEGKEKPSLASISSAPHLDLTSCTILGLRLPYAPIPKLGIEREVRCPTVCWGKGGENQRRAFLVYFFMQLIYGAMWVPQLLSRGDRGQLATSMKPAFYIARGPNLTPFCKLEVKDLWCCNWGCFKLDEMMKDVQWTYSFSFYTACWAMWAFMLQKFLHIKFVQKVSIFKVLVLKVCIKFLYIKCLYRKFRCIELLILKVLYKSFLCMMFLRTHLYI